MKKRPLLKLKIPSLISAEEDLFISKLSGERVKENWLVLQLDMEEHLARSDSSARRLEAKRLHLIADSAIPKTQVLNWRAFCGKVGKKFEITQWSSRTKESKLLSIKELVQRVFDVASREDFKILKRSRKGSKKELLFLKLTSFEVKRSGRTIFWGKIN